MGEWAATILFFLLVSTLAFGKTEFPPDLNTQAKFKAYMQKIRRDIPETATARNHFLNDVALRDVIRREQELVGTLKKDSNYMTKAEHRADPQSIKIQIVSSVKVRSITASPKWSEFINQQRVDKSQALEELRERLNEWPVRAANRFFSGWAGLLPKASRAALAEPNIKTRWEKVKAALVEVSVEELRKRFDSSLYGLPNDQWQLSDLDIFVEEIDFLENRIVALVEALNSEKTPWILAKSLPAEITAMGMKDANVILKLLGALKNRMVATFSDQADTDSLKVERELLLRELSPREAIFRGCVGNDCATASSTFVPYSPFVRNWWVEDELGNHLGYVAATMTQIGEEKCLYVHDIAGPKLSAEDIPVIVKGLWLARDIYGVPKLALMGPNFITENHRPDHQKVLNDLVNRYTQIQKQKFLDADFRRVYLGASALNYDGIDRHRNARVVSLDPEDLVGVQISREVAQPDLEKSPAANPERFWQLLIAATKNEEPSYLTAEYGRKGFHFVPLIRLINNEKRLGVEDYYEAIRQEFERQGLPYSENLAKRFDQLFQEGHLNANDAFDPENLEKTVQKIIAMVWRSPEPMEALPLLQKQMEALNNSELLRKNVASLFDRREDSDIFKIKLFSAAHFNFDNLNLCKDQLEWLLETDVFEKKMWAVRQLMGESYFKEQSAFKVLKRYVDAAATMVVGDEEAIRFLYRLSRVTDRQEALAERLPFIALNSSVNLNHRFVLSLIYFREIYAKNKVNRELFFKTVMDGLKPRSGLKREWAAEASHLFEWLHPNTLRSLEQFYVNENGALPRKYESLKCEWKLAAQGEDEDL